MLKGSVMRIKKSMVDIRGIHGVYTFEDSQNASFIPPNGKWSVLLH